MGRREPQPAAGAANWSTLWSPRLWSATATPAGWLDSLTDPVGNETNWTYDALGRALTETNELSDTRSFEYDAANRLIERTDRLGRIIQFDYNQFDQVTEERWYTSGMSLVRTLEFDFDDAGQLLEATDPSATLGFTYDSLGRATSETQSLAGLSPLLTYDRQFNALGSLTEVAATIGSTADFLNTLTYDNLQRVTQLTQEDQSGGNAVAEKRIDFAYTARGQFDTITRYASLDTSELVATSNFGYDNIGRLTSLDHVQSSATLAGYDLAYDASSRITSIDSFADGLSEFDYDHTSQLVGADHTGQSDESFSFDENGNRTMSGYSIGDNNRLLSDGVNNYTYDAEGNRLTKTNISTGDKEEYTWDHRNRLVSVTFKNSGGTVVKKVDQTYDAFNQWIKRSVDPDGNTGSAAVQDTYFSHLDGQVALQFDGSSASDLTNRYLWNPAAIDQLLADEAVTSHSSAGNVLYPLGDHLGTLRDLASYNSGTDTTTIANHRRYDSFGNLVSESNSAIDELFGYTGRALDEFTSLQNNLNRWNDARTGEFLTEDPIGYLGDLSNLYRYVENSPTVSLDPDGLQTQKATPRPSSDSLTWEDFKGKVPDNSEGDAWSNTGFSAVGGTATITSTPRKKGKETCWDPHSQLRIVRALPYSIQCDRG